jgi:hypothetical protein
MLGNTFDQLDRQNPGEFHPQLITAHGKLPGVGLPGGDVLLLADFGIARAQLGERDFQTVTRELRGSDFNADLSHVDRDGWIERLLAGLGSFFVGGSGGSLNLGDQSSEIG